jgi:chromosomal replication initiator protein
VNDADAAVTVWGATSEVLRERIPSQDFYSWFALVEPVTVSDGELVLSFANSFAVGWVRERFSEVLAQSVEQAVGRSLAVRFVSRETDSVAGIASHPSPAVAPAALAASEAPIDVIPQAHAADTLTEDELRQAVGGAARASMLAGPGAPQGGGDGNGNGGPTRAPAVAEQHGQPLNPRYRFDTFVIGEGNQLAHAAALSVAEAPGQSYNPLFIYGGTGLGKTHLLHAIGHYAMETRPGVRVAYATTEEFVSRFIAAIQRRDQSRERFKQYFRGIDILLMDDVQFLSGKGSSMQEELFHTFNSLHEAGKQVVLTSDTEPTSIPALEERLRSRFAWGLITDIATPDRATRMAILRKKALADGLDVPLDVLGAVADRITTNVRELEGAMTRIIGYASLTGRPFGVELAASVLDSYAPSVREKVTIDRIQSVVCDHFAVSHDDLVGGRKTADIVQPRQIAMYLARVLLGAPSTQVGRRFGGRDHSTVLHAERKIDGLIRNDREVYDLVEQLTHMIRQGNDRVV